MNAKKFKTPDRESFQTHILSRSKLSNRSQISRYSDGIFGLLNIDSYDNDLKVVLGENYNNDNRPTGVIGSKHGKNRKGLAMSNGDIFSCFVCGCYYVLKDIDEFELEKSTSNSSSDNDNKDDNDVTVMTTQEKKESDSKEETQPETDVKTTIESLRDGGLKHIFSNIAKYAIFSDDIVEAANQTKNFWNETKKFLGFDDIIDHDWETLIVRFALLLFAQNESIMDLSFISQLNNNIKDDKSLEKEITLMKRRIDGSILKSILLKIGAFMDVCQMIPMTNSEKNQSSRDFSSINNSNTNGESGILDKFAKYYDHFEKVRTRDNEADLDSDDSDIKTEHFLFLIQHPENGDTLLDMAQQSGDETLVNSLSRYTVSAEIMNQILIKKSNYMFNVCKTLRTMPKVKCDTKKTTIQ